MSSEEVAVCAGRKVLMDVEDNTLLIVGDPQGILDQLLWSHPMRLLNIIIIIIVIHNFKLNIVELINCSKKMFHLSMNKMFIFTTTF